VRTGEVVRVLEGLGPFAALWSHEETGNAWTYRRDIAVGAWCREHWAGGGSPLLFSSFRPEALQGAMAAAPAIQRALLLDELWSGWQAVAQSLACVAVVTNHKLMDAALKQQLDGLGLRALCYTVNEPADARRLMALGIDGLITDAVDRYSPVPDGSAVFD
jgi:glycerophosphoryl diester phosphodiesterase